MLHVCSDISSPTPLSNTLSPSISICIYNPNTPKGYFELFGLEEGVKQQLYKLASISLCSNTVGQVWHGIHHILLNVFICLCGVPTSLPFPFEGMHPTPLSSLTPTTPHHTNQNDPQVVTGLMVNPPKAGDPSFPKYEEVRSTPCMHRYHGTDDG